MRRNWGGWQWGVSKPESPAFQSPEASQGSARRRAFRLVYRVGSAIWEPTEERVWGAQWLGRSVVGVLGAWAGWKGGHLPSA